MNLLTWLDALSATGATGAPAGSAASSRRAALARLGRNALAVVPVLASVQAVTAGPPARVSSLTTDALNLVLRVAHLQQALLTAALANAALVPAPDRPRFEAMQPLLTDLIAQLGRSVSVSGDTIELAGNYDFTGNSSAAGGGPFNPLGSYDDLLLLAQIFGDTLSRILLSSLSVLSNNTVFAELVGQVLGTTSRLAADTRLLRQVRNPAVQPWIVEAENATLPPFFIEQVAAYENEDRTVVFNVLDLAKTDTTAVLSAPIPARASITAAFDQPFPLTRAEALPFAGLNQLLAPFRVI